MSEAIKREPGQRWLSSGAIGGRPYNIEGTLVSRQDFEGSLGFGWLLSDVTKNGSPVDSEGYVFYERNWSDGRDRMTLLSPVPAPCKAPDRSGCKAWCGYRVTDEVYFSQIRMGWPKEVWAVNADRWCSEACWKDRVPPLPATPVTTEARVPAKSFDSCCETDGCCAEMIGECPRCNTRACAEHADETHKCTPAQEALKAPVLSCAVCKRSTADVVMRYENCSHMVIKRPTCPRCYLMGECNVAMHSGKNSGTPYTGPARLPKAKLAHSPHDDSCVGDA